MPNYVIGYYVDADGDKRMANDVFIALVNSREDEKFYEYYSPVSQHGQLRSSYLKHCTPITLEEYKEASTLFYTPEEYLQGVREDEL